jgi:CBS domain-containing protein
MAGDASETALRQTTVDHDMSNTDRLTVEDVMTTPLETIPEDASLQEAARRMRNKNINALVVPTNPRGIISSTDILDVVGKGHDLDSLQVSDVMTRDVETAEPDLYLEEVAAMMTTYGIKHLPVVNDDYVGMISTSDLAKHLS